MRVSVVIRSKDEASRLRLTLASLARQSIAAEVVVVDDGSSDETPRVLADARGLQLVVIRNARPVGRSMASNIGAAAATGDIVAFLDGDTLANPGFVAAHLSAHANHDRLIGRGETRHLRGTRFLADPELGTPRPEEQARIAKASAAEMARMRISRTEIENDFAAIHARSTPGIYPGIGPSLLYEIEMDALLNHPGSSALWAAAAGANQSVRRADFLAAGGFDSEITINEHRELALRLCENGCRMGAVPLARSYHMTHRVGWRDPLADPDWEKRFYAAHPIPEVALLSVFWGSLSDRPAFPRAAAIRSIPELEAAAGRCRGVVGLDAVRECHIRLSCEAAREVH